VTIITTRLRGRRQLAAITNDCHASGVGVGVVTEKTIIPSTEQDNDNEQQADQSNCNEKHFRVLV